MSAEPLQPGLTAAQRGLYATVLRAAAKANTLIVQMDGKSLTYDPKRLQGGSVFTTENRVFSIGERIRFHAAGLRQAHRQRRERHRTRH